MLYLGIDLHLRQITVSLRDEGGDVFPQRFFVLNNQDAFTHAPTLALVQSV